MGASDDSESALAARESARGPPARRMALARRTALSSHSSSKGLVESTGVADSTEAAVDSFISC